MKTPERYENFKDLEIGPERREAVRSYLAAHKGIIERVCARVKADSEDYRTVVSKVLHGRATSAPVVEALEIEEKISAHVPEDTIVIQDETVHK